MAEIEVYETRKIRECCDTCLYLLSDSWRAECGISNVDDESFCRCYLSAGCCQHYWLNQHKYRRAED